MFCMMHDCHFYKGSAQQMNNSCFYVQVRLEQIQFTTYIWILFITIFNVTSHCTPVTGIGEKKVKRIYQALHTPFKKQKKSLPTVYNENSLSSSSSNGGTIVSTSVDESGS